MKTRITQFDGSPFSVKREKVALKNYKNDKKAFEKMQNNAKKYFNKCMNTFSALLKWNYDNAEKFETDYFDLQIQDNFQMKLGKIFYESLEKEQKIFDEYLKQRYTCHFSSLLEEKWNLQTSYKTIKNDIKSLKKKLAKEKKLRKQKFKMERNFINPKKYFTKEELEDFSIAPLEKLKKFVESDNWWDYLSVEEAIEILGTISVKEFPEDYTDKPINRINTRITETF